jgi:small subunit ribosomal protein S13
MVRILGTNLVNKKKIYIALTSIYGIGLAKAKEILRKLNINLELKPSELTDLQISALRDLLESEIYCLEGNLRRVINLNIKRLVDINSFRGKRHLKGLPCRGQRTRTNSRTSRLQSRFTRKIK